MVNRRDYTAEKVEAARSVLIELVRLLGEYRDHIVLIGGWVPEMIIAGAPMPHVGSMDIDLALDHREIPEEGYRTIQRLLLERGYRQGDQPFRFFRDFILKGTPVTVEVDLLAGQYGGTGKSRRHQRVQDIFARKTRGCDLAFDNPVKVTLDGELPGGGKDSVTIRVASIVPFIVMKAMALDDRLKEKDAWDIYYCLRHYPGGIDALVEEFKPHLTQSLILEGLEKMARHFASVEHSGPMHIANFEELMDEEDRGLQIRDAFERVYEYPAEYPVLWTGMNAEQGQGGCNPPHCLSRCPAL